MKVKRILSVLLILCLLASFLPGVEMTARAEGEAMPGTAAPEEDGAAELFGSAAPEDGAAELMGSVEYIPYYAPEVAILNLKNGNNSDFYESVFRDGRYNAVQAGQFKDNGGTGTALTYDVSEGKSKEYTWKNFADTNLALLSDQLGHLKVNYSTTLKNNFHDHSWKTGWFSSTTQECIGRMYAGLYFPGQARRGENGPYYAGQHCDISKQETVRMGNMEFVDMPLVFNGTRTFYQTVNGESTYDWRRSDLNLLFSNQVYHYDGGNKDCTCGGWASGNFVGFYDGEAPYVTRVETRKNGVVSTDFSAGDTIEVILHMSEPVRFASNDASGMQNVGISLTVDGSSTKMFARLTKVVNSGISGYNPNTHTYNYAAWELHFEYKVPTTITNMYRINAIDFIHVPQTDDLNTMTGSETGLIHEQADITLKQIIKNGSGTSTFDIKKPKAKNGDMDEGFNAARSYITDLAGNSMLTYCPSIRLRVDSAAPYVEKVVVNAKTNNKWLKDRLGKQATDANYIDNSDTYLGDGDYFSLTMYMNEEVFFNGFSENDEFGLLPDVAYVTTNLMFKDRDNVIRPLKLSMYLAGSTTNANGDRVSILQSDGCNVQGEYNYQQFYAFIDKYRNMYLEEGWDDQITVTGIEWITKTGDAPASGMKLHDSSGNQVQNVTMTASEYQTLKAQAKPVDPQHKLNMVPNMAYHLDTAGPTVEVQPGVQNAPNQPFYVPFSVSDSASGGSGVDGMAGSIKLTTPNGRGTSFWYSVGVSATTDSQTVWHKGNFGEAFDFTEVDGSSGQMMYLHVKPDEEQSSEEQSTEKKQVYDFSSLAAEFILSDYAGNVNKQNKTLTNVSFDNVPPTLSCGNATRRYTDQGYLTVPVTARDTCGLKTLFYLWSTDPDAE